ncbi:MAG: hypothetical protein U0L52_09465, partial [Bacteroidaceae bacterium]|nr:hypothetical protein [Bacteroidaceae bacterium]
MAGYRLRQSGEEVQGILDNAAMRAQLTAETERAQSAEQQLQTNIDNEAQARHQADTTLDGKIAAEKTRAEGAEGSLQTAINNEAQARQQADGVLDGKIAAEAQARAQADQTLDGKIGANTQAIAAEKTRAEGAEQALQTAIDTINGKIPAQATAQNQLADKNFVNSSISTATADFKGTYNSLQELEQVTANANDYAFVIATDAAGNTVYKRYKWVEGTGWTFEYDLNNSSFTAAQWAAIQSGITAALVTKLSDLPTNAELNQRISTAIANALTSYYTKTEIDTALAAINTAIGQKASQSDLTAEVTRAQQAEQANAQGVSDNAAAIAQLQSIIADIETIAEGYVRVAGSSSPALSYKSYKYHEQGGFGRESVFSLFYPCLVGTPLTGSGTEGKVLHVLQKFGARTIDGSPKWLDIYGTPHAIDGSEGDVMIVNIEPFYSINGKHTIEGTEYDVFLMSRTPFTWQGIEAEHMEKFGWSPDYCVSHTDTDSVVRMHSVYNPAWDGSYQVPQGVDGKYVYSVDSETGDIVETYDANETLLGGAGGLHSTNIDLPTGEQRAMNMNADPTNTVPWMNQTAEGCNRLMSLILAEGGTFDAHNANLMGSGFSSNDGATAAGDWEQAGSGAKNGLRVMDKNGAWKYYGLNGNVRFLTGATTGTVYAANVINSWRNPWHILEANRAMSYAIENDVHELEWFVFEGNKYKFRSVQGFNGPSHGEMTCVVWKLMATQAGANAIDPTDNATSIAGNRVEILVSTALVHGMTTQVSPSWWTSGLLFTEDENGQYECYLERDQAELVKSIAAENYDPATPRDFETIYDHVLTVQKGEGYAKNYLNGALMLPDTNANMTGAGLHTYVGKYNWFTGGNASAGKKSVRGFRRGHAAHVAYLSPLTVVASNSPSFAASYLGFGTCCRI